MMRIKYSFVGGNPDVFFCLGINGGEIISTGDPEGRAKLHEHFGGDGHESLSGLSGDGYFTKNLSELVQLGTYRVDARCNPVWGRPFWKDFSKGLELWAFVPVRNPLHVDGEGDNPSSLATKHNRRIYISDGVRIKSERVVGFNPREIIDNWDFENETPLYTLKPELGCISDLIDEDPPSFYGTRCDLPRGGFLQFSELGREMQFAQDKIINREKPRWEYLGYNFIYDHKMDRVIEFDPRSIDASFLDMEDVNGSCIKKWPSRNSGHILVFAFLSADTLKEQYGISIEGRYAYTTEEFSQFATGDELVVQLGEKFKDNMSLIK